jgi:hypothetical protein
MNQTTIAKATLTLLVQTMVLLGCAPGMITFSPQQVAIQALTQQQSPNTVIDQASILVRQTVNMDQKSFVLISYSQVEGIRRDKCLTMFQLGRGGPGGWRPNSSGGGCSGTLPGGDPPPEPAMEVVGGGRSSGSAPLDPVYSNVNGLVNQAEISKVRITWADGQVQEINVINGSYLAVRAGNLEYQKVEGLNAAGGILYSNEPQVAPGK